MALLAGSAGVAWWLSASRRFDPQAASAVLADIHKRGLPTFWGDQPAENWYLRYRADGMPVGWQVAKRIRREGGGYAGAQIEQYGDLLSIRTWTLEDNARTGQSESKRWLWRPINMSGRVVPMPALVASATSTFGNGKLKLVQVVGNSQITASPALPDDYIPSGLTDLAMYETAALGRKAVFSLLADGAAPAPGLANLQALRVTPEGGRVVRRQFDDSGEDEVMVFEKTGRLLKISYQSGGRLEASTAEAVGKIFPYAKRYQRQQTTAPATAKDKDPGLPADEFEPQERPGAAPDADGSDADGQNTDSPDGF